VSQAGASTAVTCILWIMTQPVPFATDTHTGQVCTPETCILSGNVPCVDVAEVDLPWMHNM